MYNTRWSNDLIFLCTILIFTANIFPTFAVDNTELRLVNMVFRHGDRTMVYQSGESYPNDPYLNYDFYPVGPGLLTNKGKQRAFQLGQKLKKRYGSFLGNIYLPEEVNARSTDIVRSKMSLQLALAGLYPPTGPQVWNQRLMWQPSDIWVVPIAKDGLLLPFVCPQYQRAYNAVATLPEVVEKLNSYKDMMADLTSKTGKPIRNIMDLLLLYLTFDSEVSMDLPLPRWTHKYYPNGMLKDAAVFQYILGNYNNDLRRLSGGLLLRQMIENMKSVINNNNSYKIHLYSAQDVTVGAMLLALGVFDNRVPPYSSGVAIELRSKGDKYYIRVLHYLGSEAEFKEVVMPGCYGLCPYEKFIELTKDVTPRDYELQCVIQRPGGLVINKDILIS